MALKPTIQSRVASLLASDGLDRAIIRFNRFKRWIGGQRPRLIFFYDFANPTCANAIPVALGLEGKYNVEFCFLPLAPKPSPQMEFEARIRAYRLADASREANRLRVGPILGQPPDEATHKILLAVAHLHHAQGEARKCIRSINRAVWHEGRDLSDRPTLLSLIEEIGALDPARCLREAANPATLSTLGANRKLIQKLGHWDTPLWSLDGSLFYGPDRHAFLLDALADYRKEGSQ